MDFDGDGKDDWYCIGEENARLLVFPSPGSGFGLSLPGSLDSTFCDPSGYALGDFNADGRADAACMSNGKVTLGVLRRRQLFVSPPRRAVDQPPPDS